MENQEDNNKYPLTFEEATFRKNELLSNENQYSIHYDLLLCLRKSTDNFMKLDSNNNPSFSAKNFEGRIKATFNYHPKNNDSNREIFFNFHGQVFQIMINGKQTEINHKQRRIFLSKKDLKANEKNEVIILFSTSYRHTGQGLHQFIDPADKKEYLYTQFEPFECNTVFPVFDQPDLKATLNMSLCGSNDWVLLSNEMDILNKDLENIYPINKITQNSEISGEFKSKYPEFLNLTDLEANFLFQSVQGKGYKLTHFNCTEKISSYLFALCAGPFYMHVDKSNYKVPLRIFMRESLKDCGDPQEFFNITIAGMEWYHKFFGHPYPFRKYDQIYCPEYNYGAMENVGLVTYTEVYCWREKPSNQLANRFSITVLHELAHMWFGNFVTMKWWDDLWLNESFATFISFLCQDQALIKENGFSDIYQNSWLCFNTYKDLAYREDQNANTHSVYSEIEDTEKAHSNFDMIVYYKGSSLLKQMFHFIQEKNFSEGLNNYFAKYKWSNSVFDNFIDEMTNAISKRTDEDSLRKSFDLKNLSKKWLTETGLNQIELIMKSSDDKKISEFDIRQSPCLKQYPNLQNHLMDVLFLYKNKEPLVINDVLVEAKENTSIKKVIGIETPDAVLLNYNDHSYVKWIIDENSFNFLKRYMHKKLDLLSKKLVYRSLYDSMRDGKIASFEYIETLLDLLEDEKDENLLVNNFNFILTTIQYFLPRRFQEYFYTKTNDLVSIIISDMKLEDKNFSGLMNTLISTAVTQTTVGRIDNWVTIESEGYPYLYASGESVYFSKSDITQDHRFAILQKIFQMDEKEYSLHKKVELLEQEKQRDKNTDKSIKAELTCTALQGTKENKQEIWNMIVNNPNKESLHNIRALMMGFAPYTQIDLVKEFLTEKFFEAVPIIAKNDYFYIDYFLMFCSPSFLPTSENIIEKFEKLINSLDSSRDYTKKKLNEMIDEIKRYQKVHAFTEEKAKTHRRFKKF